MAIGIPSGVGMSVPGSTLSGVPPADPRCGGAGGVL